MGMLLKYGLYSNDNPNPGYPLLQRSVTSRLTRSAGAPVVYSRTSSCSEAAGAADWIAATVRRCCALIGSDQL